MKKIIFFAIIFLYFFSIYLKPAQAGYNPPNEILGRQDQPSAAYNPDNDEFFTVFSDCRDSSDPNVGCSYGARDIDHNIFGQLVSGNGSCLGGNIPIYKDNQVTGEQYPNVVYNPNMHEYLVTWQGHKYAYNTAATNYDMPFNQGGYDILGQRISSITRQKVGGVIHISSIPASSPTTPGGLCFKTTLLPPLTNLTECDDQQWHPRAAYSTQDHRYMVVWHDARMRARYYEQNPGYWKDINDKTTFKDIYGQILDDNGSPVGDNFPVSLDLGNSSTNPDASKRFPIYYGSAPRIQQYAEIAYDNVKNRFLVVWEDDRDGTGDPHPITQQYDQLNLNIYGGFFDSNGQNLKVVDNKDNFLISSLYDGGRPMTERYPKVVYNQRHDEFLVVWGATWANNYSADPGNVVKAYGLRLNANGQKIDSVPFIIEENATTHLSYYNDNWPPQVTATVNLTASSTHTGQYLISWLIWPAKIIKARWLTPQGAVSTLGTKMDFSVGSSNSPFITFRNKAGEEKYLLTWLINKSGNDFFSAYRVGIEPSQAFTNCPASGGPPPITNTPRPSPTTEPSPTTTPCLTCSPPFLPKAQGNAFCDNFIDLLDFELWRREANNILNTQNANFNCGNSNGQNYSVGNEDFNIWKNNF